MALRLRRRPAKAESEPQQSKPSLVDGTIPIAEVRWRHRVRVAGRVRSVRIQPLAGVPTLQLTLVDGTGGIAVVFLGRRHIAGIRPGVRMVVEGMVGDHDRRLAVLNPDYWLLPPATPPNWVQ